MRGAVKDCCLGVDTIPESAITAIIIMLTAVPAVAYISTVICSFKFDLSDKKLNEIQAALAERNAERS